MKLTFVGVGAASSPMTMAHSNMLIEQNGKLLLIDAGSDIRHSLADLPYGINGGNVGTKLDAVYISHLHADHIGGMEWIALCSRFVPPHRRPVLYSNHSVMNEMWDHSLKGGLETIEGKVADLTDYFECKPIADNGEFTWEGMLFQPIQTLHIVSGRKFQHSYGLMIWPDGNSNVMDTPIFITTDTQFCPKQLIKFYGDAKLIFHDCETSPFPSNVHAHYNDLKTLPDWARQKMWLYHYNSLTPTQDAKADGFMGYVVKGQSFEF